MTRIYEIEGLNCSHCAIKIEDRLKEKYDSVNLNFTRKKLIIDSNEKIADGEVSSIIDEIESGVSIRELLDKETIEKQLFLKNLNCSSCAQKIVDKINNEDNVNRADFDIITGKLNLEYDSLPENFIERISEICNMYESGVEVLENREEKVRKSVFSDAMKANVRISSIGVLIFIGAILFNGDEIIKTGLFILAYLLVGGDIVKKAFSNILRGQFLDENFLMTIATFGAFGLGENIEAVAVMLFYKIGEAFQDIAVNKSRRDIKSLLDLKSESANLIDANGKIIRVVPEKLKLNDIVVIKKGEKIPTDGVIVDGESIFDTSSLTGESVGRVFRKGDEVLSGYINTGKIVEMKVMKEYKNSAVYKILDMVENASSKKSDTEKFITKFAKYYTPIVVGVALLLAAIPTFMYGFDYGSEWIKRALIFLVVSCPCALVVSIPLGYFAGIGKSSKQGILIKGSNYLDILGGVKTIVFDKTGTLTKGVFKVTNISVFDEEYDEDAIIEYAAYAEYYSNHPIADAIRKSYGKTIGKDEIFDHEDIDGKGTLCKYKSDVIAVGNMKMMNQLSIAASEIKSIGTLVYVAVNGKLIGVVEIADEIKAGIENTIKDLKKLGVSKTVMLTGDHGETAKNVSEKIGIDEYYSDLLPQDKVEIFEEIQNSTKGKVAFVGDGINDAPVLARSDVGISMGSLGQDAAVEASDVVLVKDEINAVAKGIKISKYTKSIVKQNIVLALGIKFIVLGLSTIGLANMWMAIFADVGVSLLAVLNSTRILKGNY